MSLPAAQHVWHIALGITPEIEAPPLPGNVDLTEPPLMPTVAMIGSVVPAAAITRSVEDMPSVVPPPVSAPAVFCPPTPIAGYLENAVRRAYVQFGSGCVDAVPAFCRSA